jgi:hypothetical protein
MRQVDEPNAPGGVGRSVPLVGSMPSSLAPRFQTDRGWRRRVRRAAADLFEFEAEEGRVRLAGLRPLSRWLAVLGLSTIGLLVVASFFLSAFRHGQLAKVPSTPVSIWSATVAVSLVWLGIAWALALDGLARSSRSLRVVGAFLFLLSNGLLVVNLPPVGHAGLVTTLFGLAKVAMVGTPLSLVVLAALPSAMPSPVVSLLRGVAAGFSVLFFASLLVAEGAGGGTPLVRLGVASGVLQELSTLVLLLAPLLYLTGMAVLSLTYALGAVTSEMTGGLRRWAAWAVVVGLVAGEAWFFGWRDRSSLWPGSHGWVVLLHVVPLLAGFAAIVWLGQETLRGKPVRVHDSGSAVAALLVTIPSIVAGMYFALWAVSTIGFLHVPAAVSSGLESSRGHVVNVILSTGPRCVLFGVVSVASVMVLRHPSSTHRQCQLAIGLALMSGWMFWTTFIDWLPGTDTADEAFFALCALAAVMAYLAVSWRLRRNEARTLGRAVGALVVIWAFDADAGFLRSLSHLVPVEGAIVLVVGIGLILVGKSQFTGGTSLLLPRDARVVLWIGYLVLALSLTYWERGVSGFATLTANNGEVSVLSFIGVPYLVWLVVSGRFDSAVLTAREAPAAAPVGEPSTSGPGEVPVGSGSDGDAEGGSAPPGGSPRGRWRPLVAGVLCAGLLAGSAAAADAIDGSAIARPVPIAGGVGVVVPDHWSLDEKPPLALLTRRDPWSLVLVAVGHAAVASPARELQRLLHAQSFLSGVTATDVASFGLGSTGPFSVIALARFDAVYRSRAVVGQAFTLLSPRTKLVAFGVVVARQHGDLLREASQIEAIEQSLDTPGISAPLW